MPRLRRANGLFWQCIAAATVCALSQCSPHVVFTQPNNGDIIPNITSLEFKYEVVCAEDLTALAAIVWTPVSAATSGFRIPLPQSFVLFNLETGSQAVMISLHPASNTSHVISESWLHFEIVPPGVPEINPVYASYTRASVAPDPPFLSLPLNITIISDTTVFDGMKTFFIDYIRVFTSFGARVTVMDGNCKLPDTYIAPYGNDSTRVGSAMLSAGAALLRHCLVCPVSVCSGGSTGPLVTYDGPLHTAEKWEDVPQALRELLSPLYTALVDQDVLLFAWMDGYNADPTRAGTLLQAHLSLLANPSAVRGADLGPSAVQAAGHARVADFYTAPSHFIAHTRRPPTGQPVVVMQPILDDAMFAPQMTASAAGDAKQADEGLCAARYGKPVGGKLVGMIARMTATKSPGLFIRAAALVTSTLPNVRFVFAGTADEMYSTAMELLATSLSLNVSTFGFLGFIPRAELPELYSCLDAVVFTSATKYETFGIVNLEAMAMGIPIVHFGVNGLQDYFIDRENSVLAREFTPEALAASVLSLLSSEERRVAIGTQAAAFVQRYLAAGVTSPRVAASILHLSNMGRLDPFVSLPLNGSVSALPVADGAPPAFEVYLYVIPVITDVSAALAKQIPEPNGANDTASLLALFNERQLGAALLCFRIDDFAPTCGEWSDPPPSVLLSLPPGAHTASSWVTRPSRSTNMFKSWIQFIL